MGNMIADDLANRIPMSPFLTATLARAADYATAQSHTEVAIEHLLLALTEDPEASVVLKSSNVDIARLNNEVSDFIGRIEDRQPEGTGGSVISADLRRILEAAAAAAQQGRRREINGAIVLAAIVGDGKSAAAHMLRSQGLTFEEAIRALQRAAQAKAAAPTAPAAAPASADELLASARERVMTRAATVQREIKPEPASAPIPEGPSIGRPSPRFSGAPPPEVDADLDEFLAEAEQGPTPVVTPASEVLRVPAPGSGSPAQSAPGGLGSLTTEPEIQGPNFGAPAPPSAPAPSPSPHLESRELPNSAPRPPAVQPDRPAPAGRRQPSWAPPAQRNTPPPQPAQGPPVRGGRAPPPLPPSPGPLQIPGQITTPFPGGAAPAAPGIPRGAPPQSRVPWPETIDPPAAPVASRPDGAVRPRQQGPRTVISSGQLVHNIPARMRVGISLVCEARIGRAEVKAIVEGLQGGGAVVRHEIMVTKAMSVRLRSPDGGFFIEGNSPETQWIENVLGLPAEDFARWRWTITPRERGRKRLQLIVSARTVGSDGLTAETAMPDQVIEIRVKTNYMRSLKRWLGWSMAAIVGGILARFGDAAFEAAKTVMAMISGSH